MNFANDVNEKVPRTTKTELRAGLHRTRSMERHKALISTRHASQIVLESFDLPPQSSHSAPEDLLGAFQETRHLPTELLRPSGRSKCVQIISKGFYERHVAPIEAAKTKSLS